MTGAFGYVVVFGGEFSAKRAQAIVERFALMLGPMVDGPGVDKETGQQGADEARQQGPQATLALHKTMEPVLARELASANGKEKIEEILNQVSEVRQIMEKNVELILDRQEQLEDLEANTTELEKGAHQFRKGTRKLRRWHLMNQVKFGVAVGTAISVAVAIPIVLLATA
jgi:vesicle-associated membrane protein 4